MITALLVDDEPKALDRLAEMLEKFETIDVIGRSQSVAEAERFLRGRAPDVVFLDITMPGRRARAWRARRRTQRSLAWRRASSSRLSGSQ